MARTESTEIEERPRAYGNFRTPASKGMGGLGTVGTLVIFGGLLVCLVLLMLQLWIATGVVALAFAVVAGLMKYKNKHGRTVMQRVVRRASWLDAKYKGSNIYRSGPISRIPGATCKLPGISARSRVSEFEDSYGRPFALIELPQKKHYTVVFGSEPDGGGMVDQDQINRWVDRWGFFLGSMTDEPGLVAASVTIETSPDTGFRLARRVQDRMSENASDFAREVVEQTVADLPTGSTTTKAYVAMTFKAATRANGKVRSLDQVADDLGSRLPNITAMLNGTGAGVSAPLTKQQLCEVIRIAYDPRESALFDQAYAQGQAPLLEWNEVGPQAHDAFWDCYHHNNVWSKSWAMSVPPRSTVQAGVLQGLVRPMQGVLRKRVSLLYRPIDPARAAMLVERDYNTATFNASSRHRASSRDDREIRAARATSEEEAEGAGLLNLGLVVSATVGSKEELPDLEAAIDSLGISARIRLEEAYGAQDSTFAAALPLGVVIPEHLALPSAVRDGLN